MSFKRHLFPVLGSLVIIADVIPPRPEPKPDQPAEPPSSPGCTLYKPSRVSDLLKNKLLAKDGKA